jgi:hypothetical protein
MATAMFAETLDNSQHSTRLNTEAEITHCTNTFYFHECDLNYFILCVNAVQYHSEALMVDISSISEVTRAYEKIFSGTGIHHDDRSHMITLDMFFRDQVLWGDSLSNSAYVVCKQEFVLGEKYVCNIGLYYQILFWGEGGLTVVLYK